MINQFIVSAQIVLQWLINDLLQIHTHIYTYRPCCRVFLRNIHHVKGPASILDLISVTGLFGFCSVWMEATAPYAPCQRGGIKLCNTLPFTQKNSDSRTSKARMLPLNPLILCPSTFQSWCERIPVSSSGFHQSVHGVKEVSSQRQASQITPAA